MVDLYKKVDMCWLSLPFLFVAFCETQIVVARKNLYPFIQVSTKSHQINTDVHTHTRTHTCAYTRTHLRVHLHIHSPPIPTNAHVCTHTQYIFVFSNSASLNYCVKTPLWNSALSVFLAHLTYSDCVQKWRKGKLSLGRSDLLCFSNPSTMPLPKILVDTLPQLSASPSLSLISFHPLPYLFPCQFLR